MDNLVITYDEITGVDTKSNDKERKTFPVNINEKKLVKHKIFVFWT